MMLRLNIRHQIPQTAIRRQWGHLDEASVVPAELHGDFQNAQSNKGATQPTTQIDNYPSRRAYGARNMTDFTRENGQRGIADARSGTSRRTQEAWARAENDGKRGDQIAQRARQEMFSKYTATPVIDFELMPAPEISVNPSEVVGESTDNHFAPRIDTTPFPVFNYTPGSTQTYVENQGFIHRWVTQDKYDIQA